MQEILYDTIGSDYDATRKADPFLLSRIIDLLKPVAGKCYLDIGCGTGNYTIALKEKGFDICGLEPSEIMLQAARTKNKSIQWLCGSSENIPLDNQTIEGIVAVLTIHHWKDINQSFKEINRVLNEKGRIVFFTSTPEQMQGYWLNHYFPGMLQSSIKKMPSLSMVSKALDEADLEIVHTEKYFVSDELEDHFLYTGKNRPELYFNSAIRKGISSFSSLANSYEISAGLHTLKNDIELNKFNDTRSEYENDLGDYLFIVADKKPKTII